MNHTPKIYPQDLFGANENISVKLNACAYCYFILSALLFITDTTPPKQKLQHLERDFYTAGFTPGALVHFSYDALKGFFLTIQIY